MTIVIDGYEKTLDELPFLAKRAVRVLIENDSEITSLPDFPSAMIVILENLPNLAAMPKMPKVRGCVFKNLPLINKVSEISRESIMVFDGKLQRN